MATQKLTDRRKFDIALIGQTINNGNVVGPYYDMRRFEKAAAVCIDGASIVNKVTKLEFLQATDAAGTGAKVVKQSNASAGTESAAANAAAATVITKATKVLLTLASMANADTITINGITYTAHTDTTTVATRQFKIDGNDDADAVALAGLINHATAGVPGVTATAGTASVTLTSTAAGERDISATTSNATRCAPSIVEQLLISEIDIHDMDLAGGFRHLAVRVTKAGNGIVAVTLVRESGDYPRQQITAATTVL